MAEYKVRLSDGSEIGPMDADSVRSWYEQGLLGPNSAVLKTGMRRWTSLAQVFNVQDWDGGTHKRRRRRKRKAQVAAEMETTPKWRMILTGAMLLVVATGAFLAHFFPERCHPDLEALPWLYVGLGHAVAGLLLLRGWELGRRVVRILLFLASFGLLFPAAALLVARDADITVLLVPLSALVLGGGFLALLARGHVPALRLSAGLLTLAAGAAGLVYFTFVPESRFERDVHEWAAADKRFANEDLGLELELPPGWVMLPRDNPLVNPSDQDQLVFAHAQVQALGLLGAASLPPGSLPLDSYLDQVLARRARGRPEAPTVERQDVAFGDTSARQAVSTWSQDGTPYREVTTVWRDAWVYASLTTWCPDLGGRSRRELEGVTQALRNVGSVTVRMRKVAAQLSRDVPQLSLKAAEALLLQAGQPSLTPEVAFRWTVLATNKGLPALRTSEVEEFGTLTHTLYDNLTRRQRKQLQGYVDRVRVGVPAEAEEERAMAGMVKAAMGALPDAFKARLQLLHEDAIKAGLKSL